MSAAPVHICVRLRRSVGACTPVAVVLLTRALQAMLFLQRLAAQRARGTTGEGTWHQMMPIAVNATHFLFGLPVLVLHLLFLRLFFAVLTLQRNKERGRLVFSCTCCVLQT